MTRNEKIVKRITLCAGEVLLYQSQLNSFSDFADLHNSLKYYEGVKFISVCEYHRASAVEKIIRLNTHIRAAKGRTVIFVRNLDDYVTSKYEARIFFELLQMLIEKKPITIVIVSRHPHEESATIKRNAL